MWVSEAIFANITQNILHILVEEKKEGRDTVLTSVFAKDKDFVLYHLPKSQMKFLTEFNDRKT